MCIMKLCELEFRKLVVYTKYIKKVQRYQGEVEKEEQDQVTEKHARVSMQFEGNNLVLQYN